MNKIIFTIIISLCSITAGFSQKNQSIIDFQKNNSLKNASIGILIQDVNGKEIVSLNKSMSLTPASTLKVVTTASILETFSEDFRYNTSMSYDNNTITVRGEGDPTLGSEHLYEKPKTFLEEWSSAVIKQGITIPIHLLYIQDNYFGYQGTSSKWIREDLGNYYAAGAYGISIFDNTYRLFFNTMDTNNVPKIQRTEPGMNDIEFLNTLKYNSTGKDNGYIWGEPFSSKRQLVGDIPAKRTSFAIKGDIPDPGMYLGKCFAESLFSKGVKVESIATGKADYYSTSQLDNSDVKQPFYIYKSPPLKDIIRVVNVKSNNHYAEHLIRTLGRSQNRDIYSDPLKEGINYISSFWREKGYNVNGLFMYDGCGLAPSNAINVELMCDILRYMFNESKYSESFLASFPRAGMEGTVRNFLKGTRLESKVYIKSGSIANVQSYAGYYVNGTNKYVFSVIVNNFQNDNRREVVKAIESLLLNAFP